MTEATTAPGGASPGSGQPAPASQAGSAPPAGGRENGGTSDEGSLPNRDAVWKEARAHFEPEVKKAQTEAAELRKRLAKYEVQAKSAEQLEAELTQTRTTLEKQHEIVKGFAETRVDSLPEHLREILVTSSGGDPLKTLELLPKFEDLAKKTQLKTLGGNQQGGGTPNIDFNMVQGESARGNTRPLMDAYKLLGNGDINVGKARYNTALNEFLARGKR